MEAEDPDGDSLSYAWTADCGDSSFDDETSDSPIFTLNAEPALGEDCTVSVEVTDERGGDGAGMFSLNVGAQVELETPLGTCGCAGDECMPLTSAPAMEMRRSFGGGNMLGIAGNRNDRRMLAVIEGGVDFLDHTVPEGDNGLVFHELPSDGIGSYQPDRDWALPAVAMHPNSASNNLAYLFIELDNFNVAPNVSRIFEIDMQDWSVSPVFEGPEMNFPTEGGALAVDNDGVLYAGVGSTPGYPGGSLLKLDVSGDSAVEEARDSGLSNPKQLSIDECTGRYFVVEQPLESGDDPELTEGWILMGSLSDPSHDWARELNSSVGLEVCNPIGGFVYRGVSSPDLVGYYIYGDGCTGEVFAIDPELVGPSLLLTTIPAGSGPIRVISEGYQGEVFALIGNRPGTAIYQMYQEDCPEPDECGVCGGYSNTCLDCDGVPNGRAVLDECGVCDGDGSSCAPGREDCADGVDNDQNGLTDCADTEACLEACNLAFFNPSCDNWEALLVEQGACLALGGQYVKVDCSASTVAVTVYADFLCAVEVSAGQVDPATGCQQVTGLDFTEFQLFCEPGGAPWGYQAP